MKIDPLACKDVHREGVDIVPLACREGVDIVSLACREGVDIVPLA